MRIRLNYITPLLVAGAAAAAIAAAPTAMAATANSASEPSSCFTQGICPNTQSTLSGGASSGNVQLNASPGPVQYSPQYPYSEGDYGGYGYGGGGYGGGGFGGGFGGGHGGGGGHGR
ncbi:MAG: hypothetical protein JWR32_4152 [Mycobacterium sp.]|jgi:hypothetical protein|nr:hypothetical protein [Mycobacterium sp.]